MDSRSPSTPLSPYALSNDRYKTNVNRTKTRKWVEAKKVDYGGDDWGADDDFEEEEEEEAGESASAAEPYQAQPQPLKPGRLTAGLRAIGDGSGPSTPRSGSTGSARSLRPSERIAIERQGSGGQQRSVTSPPALHIQTGAQAQPQPQAPAQAAETQASLAAAQTQFPPRKSSMTDQQRPDLTIDPLVHPPRTSSTPQSPPGGPGVRSPPSAVGSSAQPRVIRPSEIYRRMEEEREKERRSSDSARRSSLESAGSRGGDTDGPEAAVKSPRRPSFGRNDSGEGARPLQPLATVDERKSEYGFDGLIVNPGGSGTKESSDPAGETTRDIETKPDPEPSLLSQPPPPTLEHPQPSEDPEPRKRFSTSPKLPDLTRMSGFGSDFFSGAGDFMSGSPKQPEAPAEAMPTPTLEPTPAGVTHTADRTGHEVEEKTTAPTHDQPTERYSSPQIPEPSQPKPRRPTIPGGWVSETASTPGEMATPGSEQVRYGLGIDTRNISTISEHAEDSSLKPAPLRTPTPRDRSPKKIDEERSSNRSAQPSPHMPSPLRTTPSPLFTVQPSDQKGDIPAEDEDESDGQQASAPAPLQPRTGSAPESPTEELREPIMREDTISTTENTSPLKDSDVLRDEIIRSLSPVRSSDQHLDTLPDEGATRDSAYLSDVYGDYWKYESHRADEPGETDAGGSKPLATVKEESGSASASPSPLAQGWASEVTPLSGEPSAVPASEPEPDMRRKRFSWEAASEQDTPAAPSPTKHPLPEPPMDEASPSAAASEPASPIDSGRHSPLLTLPVLNFGRDDDTSEEDPSRVVSAVSTLPPGQDATHIESPSPASHASGHNGPSSPADRGSRPFSPSSPTSPATDADATQPLHADSPSPTAEPAPTNIPLPRSPSPTRAVGGDGDRSPSSQQHVMNLKQIMALPTAPERVYKMVEARAEFASMPSGLGQWLSQLMAQPEHANAAAAFKYAPAGDDLLLFANQKHRGPNAAGAAGAEGGGGGGEGRLHAGTGLSMGAGVGSVRIPGASAAQMQLGNLMHGQAGVKGKELLQSAGKMGKGLLSKGKNKLRERAESKKG